jgi:hypothetical protein
VTHIGSGFESEIDHSLDILSELVEHYLTKMAPFAIFVKVSENNHYQYVSQGFQLSPVKWKNRYLFIKHRCVFFGKHVCFLQQHIYILFNEKNGRVWLWDEFGSGEWLGRSCGLDMG